MSTPLFDRLKLPDPCFIDDPYYCERLPGIIREDDQDRIRSGGAWFDYSFNGRIKMTGKHALDLLQRLSTHELRNLAVNVPAVTVLTNEKGRVIDVLTVIRRPDHLMLGTSANNAPEVMKWLDRYIIMEDVQLQDLSNQTLELRLYGSTTPANALQASDAAIEKPFLFDTPFGESRKTLLAHVDHADAVFDWLSGTGLTPVGLNAIESRRIDSIRPLLRREITGKFNPIELGLTPFISFTKGCYIGQEVIARLDSYDKVQRNLVQWEVGELSDIIKPPFEFAEKKMGEITSWIRLRSGAWQGLAVVKKEFMKLKVTDVNDSAGNTIKASFYVR